MFDCSASPNSAATLALRRDWSKVTHQDAVQLVHQIEGGTLLTKKDIFDIFERLVQVCLQR